METGTLIAHVDTERIAREQLALIPTPPGTDIPDALVSANPALQFLARIQHTQTPIIEYRIAAPHYVESPDIFPRERDLTLKLTA